MPPPPPPFGMPAPVPQEIAMKIPPYIQPNNSNILSNSRKILYDCITIQNAMPSMPEIEY